MTITLTCPACTKPHPAPDFATDPNYCSIACYHNRARIDPPGSPSCHDAVTMNCPVCQHPFTPVGRQRFCTDACRAAAYRRRRDAHPATLVVPKIQPRRPITVYECDTCQTRSLGEQRCDICATFMRRVGIGGHCPSCDEPIAVSELVDQEVITTTP